MARNSLLRFDSHHPRSLRENLPFGQFLRVRRNCSNIPDFRRKAKDLSMKLKVRRYPNNLVRTSMKRAANNHREALLEPPVVKPPLDRLVCVTTYNTSSSKIQKMIRKRWRILNSSGETIPLPLFSFKRGNNLRDSLVHTRPRQEVCEPPQTLWGLPPVRGHHPCGNCSVCPLTSKTLEVDIGTSRPWQLKHHTNCNSEKVIYQITCPCGLRYIGMTARKIKLRVQEHMSTMRRRKQATRLTTHFLDKRHSPDELRWLVLEQPYIPSHVTDVSLFLLRKEQKWVFKLHSDTEGLNDDIPWMQL